MRKFLLVLFSILLLAGCSSQPKPCTTAVFDENGLHWDGPMPRLEFDMARFQEDHVAIVTNVGEGNAINANLRLGASDGRHRSKFPEYPFGDIAPGGSIEADLSDFMDDNAGIWNGALMLRFTLEGQTVTIVHELDTGGDLT